MVSTWFLISCICIVTASFSKSSDALDYFRVHLFQFVQDFLAASYDLLQSWFN